MNDLALSFISAILIGLGATLTFDLWGLLLKYAFKNPAIQHLFGWALASNDA